MFLMNCVAILNGLKMDERKKEQDGGEEDVIDKWMETLLLKNECKIQQ